MTHTAPGTIWPTSTTQRKQNDNSKITRDWSVAPDPRSDCTLHASGARGPSAAARTRNEYRGAAPARLRGESGIPVRLKIDVHAFKPGNTAERILIGFGAGRGSLIYTARQVSEDGEVLAGAVPLKCLSAMLRVRRLRGPALPRR